MPPLGVQALWLLDDFREDNGGTMFLPGSHLVDGVPDGISAGGMETPPAAQVLIAPAGSVLIAHSAWWHRQTVNRSDAPRTALLGNYTSGHVVPKDGMERQWREHHEAIERDLRLDSWERETFADLWLGRRRRGLYCE